MTDKPQQLYIPKKLRIGYQSRPDTYTQKLAYVVYYDDRGKLRKESSWNSWRDHKIDPVEVDNVPIEGFVLNKKVGGHGRGWHHRQAHIRVYDPRDFEFEIDVPNLVWILAQCDCNKGKGLEGKFVYAWDGNNLVLLPVESEDYRNSRQFTDLQAMTFKARDLAEGHRYETRKQEVWTYLGKRTWHNPVNYDYSWRKKENRPSYVEHLFWDGKFFVATDKIKNIARCVSDSPDPTYPALVDRWHRSLNGTPIKRVFTEPIDLSPSGHNRGSRVWAVGTDGAYRTYSTHFDEDGQMDYHDTLCSVDFRDGQLHRGRSSHSYINKHEYSYDYRAGQSRRPNPAWFVPTDPRELRVELESGSVFRYDGYSLSPIDEVKHDDDE